ncbi:MAG: Sec-independent protein translocase subunit TatA [Frankiaceae bacterium]|nr:Sec-independent protein translocase subunit TatA [Frankiaceae bacterium]
MGLERPTVWIILAVVALALFGYKRLPDASRSVGRSLRIFKSELKGLSSDDDEREAAKQAAMDSAADDAPTQKPAPAAPAGGDASAPTAD